MKKFEKTSEGKLKVTENVDIYQEFTYEDLEQQILNYEQQLLLINQHLDFFRELKNEADNLNITKTVKLETNANN